MGHSTSTWTRKPRKVFTTSRSAFRGRIQDRPELFRSLIDPGADEPDLFFGQRRDFVFVVGRRHVKVFIANVSNIVDEHAVGAFAGFNNFVLATLQSRLEAVEAEFAFLFFRAMTLGAGLFK